MTEIVDLLMESDREHDIFIEPPDVHDLTDEDSGDENLDGNYNVDKLSRGQLLAPAECRSLENHREAQEEEYQTKETNNSDPIKKRRKVASTTNKKIKKLVTWTKDASSSCCKIFPEQNFSQYRDLSPVEIFELFVDNNLLELMKNEMTKYSAKRNWPDVNVQSSELQVFLAILILSGYDPLPRTHMYWSRSADVYNEAVSNAMRRDRFEHIKKCLHFNSSNLDTSDKYTKLRPLIQHFKKKFMLHFVPNMNISHDEAMIEYFGKHGCKQAIRNKPVRFGYKAWCQNTPQGYLCSFDLYQGKTYEGNDDLEDLIGKCPSTVFHLLASYCEEKKVLPYHFFFDNLFTSFPLLKELVKHGYNGTGTLRSNRLEKSCPLKSVASMDKLERGCIDAVTGICGEAKINTTRWKDNAVVTIASTLLREDPIGKVKRWSKQLKKYIQVDIPHVVDTYNKNMGGTDRMDENINAYRISIRGKKWWWPLFTWLIDASIQNAWILAKCTGKNLDQLQFRREITMSYLLRFRNLPKSTGKKSASKPGEQDARYDQVAHFIQPTPEGKRRRCQGEMCGSRVRSQCSKCDVGLCIPCFQKYHIR